MSTTASQGEVNESETIASASPREVELLELKGAFRGVFRTLSRLRGRDTHLGASELSHAQFELLAELAERGGLPAGELAIAAELSPGTVTQMLDHLAECGHVERVRSDADRRVVVSRLTPQGRRKLTAKREAWKGRWEQALGEFDVEDLRTAKRVLARVGAMLAEPPVEARSGRAQTVRSAVQRGSQK
jgi:DNA-binding MarR family transcriptional regulator